MPISYRALYTPRFKQEVLEAIINDKKLKSAVIDGIKMVMASPKYRVKKVQGQSRTWRRKVADHWRLIYDLHEAPPEILFIHFRIRNKRTYKDPFDRSNPISWSGTIF